MRKIVLLDFVSLDGVIQAPGGPNEDTSGGFAFGGWTVPYSDEVIGGVMAEQMGQPYDLLLGRKTYDIFASYWPNQDEAKNPGAVSLNKAKKYVISRNPELKLSWQESELISGDVPAKIKELKAGDGPMLQVYGSSDMIQTLLKNDLVDELWLKIYPVTLGSGKRLFGEGAIPAGFRLKDSKVSPVGVIVASFERDGDVQTGSFE